MRRILAVFVAILTAWAYSVSSARSERTSRALRELDVELARASYYIDRKVSRISRLMPLYEEARDSVERIRRAEELGDIYSPFNTDSALVYYDKALADARSLGIDSLIVAMRIKRAVYLPLAGFIDVAEREYSSIAPDSLPLSLRRLYFASGHRMFNYVASLYESYEVEQKRWKSRADLSQQHLLELIDPESSDGRLCAGEFFYTRGEYAKSQVILSGLLEELPDTVNAAAHAAYFLAQIARVRGNMDDYCYYLAKSAVADVRSATLEVTALQELGAHLYREEDIIRAYRYLSAALANAVECRALMRIAQSAESLPMIQSAHEREISAWRTRIYGVVAMLVLLLCLLLFGFWRLRSALRRMDRLQRHLRQTNRIKDEYLSQFLNLCAVFMDKLNRFSDITRTKITAGKADELLKMAKSGKFIEEESREFFMVFDDAFLHIYPNFVERVNALLRPEERVRIEVEGTLNTDMRILALMRLGVDEGARIARVLNYSVNTIYAYRNKMRNRAINRDTFEADVMAIDS